ncbi:MAG: MFS transporter [Anaerolineae bacterium]|nr:MFS transporter [Anaerolineae bacterium]
MRWLTLTMIVGNIATWMYMPFLPLYLGSLGASAEQVGIFYTVQVAASLASRIVGGWISDHMGRLAAVWMGSIPGWLALVGFLLAPTWEWLMVVVLVRQMGVSLVAPSFRAYIAENAPEGSLSRTFGLVEGLFLICNIIGPLLGGVLIERVGYQAMFAVATIIFTIALLIRRWLARRANERVQLGALRVASLGADLRNVLGMLAVGGLLFWLFVTDGLMDAALQLQNTFAALYMRDVLSIGETEFGVLMSAFSVVAALSMVPAGMLADRYGERWSIALGAGSGALLWLVITQTNSLPLAMACFCALGAGRALVEPAFSALVSRAVPRESLEMTWGVFLTAFGLVAIPAPYVGGLLYDYSSPQATFYLVAGLAVATIPLVLARLHAPEPGPQLAAATSSTD